MSIGFIEDHVIDVPDFSQQVRLSSKVSLRVCFKIYSAHMVSTWPNGWDKRYSNPQVAVANPSISYVLHFQQKNMPATYLFWKNF